MKEHENTIYQNLWYAIKAVLRRKVIAENAYMLKRKISNQYLKILL
jgi:hypothetical protein